ncbi:MAG: DUF1501 domain-containing protein [Planctomycetota bacterium]|nr:DUF1501 domain-containing protein [Planctomycetota bacterium]
MPQESRTDDPLRWPGRHLSRRELLRRSAVGFGHLALCAMLAEEAAAREAGSQPEAQPGAQPGAHPEEARNDPLRPRPPHHPPRARRIIFLFMKGGPSHVDTFDHKPRLDRDHGKPLPFAKPRVQFAKTGTLLRSPWKFRRHGESGVPVSELFPHVARCVDDICFIHSLHGTNAAHGGAVLKLHTGSDSLVRPSLGSWVTYGLGSETRDLPGFVTICPTLAHGGVNNWGSAFLPAPYQGTPLGVASEPSEKAVVRHLARRLPRDLQRLQLDLLQRRNREFLERSGWNLDLEGRIESFELGFRMQAAMPEVQDISGESPQTLKLYGLDEEVTADFGRQCLLARRFAERGVRFIQVTHSDTKVQWDQHAGLKKGHEKNAREVDRPIAGLLRDLEARGLLQDTLVLWGGEFGRTPTAQNKDGRDHNPEGFTVWLAGGGVRGGLRYGATDEYGYYAAEDRVHVHDLHATLLHLLGLDHERLTYRYGGRDFRLTDVSGRVVHEILA